MCTIFFAIQAHPKYPLVIAANRDEFYHRKTALLQDWGTLVGGRDLEKGGYWLAMAKSGRFAALTNYRDMSRKVESPISRGELVANYLQGDTSIDEYLQQVSINKDVYEGFNLVLGDEDSQVAHYSNITDQVTACVPGVYGLSNALLDTGWPKVKQGKREFQRLLDADSLDEHHFLGMLDNREPVRDSQELPNTGIPLAMERMLSALFVSSPAYGTRSSTVAIVNDEGLVRVTEQAYGVLGRTLDKNTVEFSLR